jgi:dUTP pyrophosphatase
MKLQIKLIPPSDPEAIPLPLPCYATPRSAGLDLRAWEDMEIYPCEHALVRTGLLMAIPIGYEGQVRPRSGIALGHRVTVLNAPGTIDADYRDEVKVILVNHGNNTFHVKRGDRIAQLVIAPVKQVEIEEVKELPTTSRKGGLGHTGIK